VVGQFKMNKIVKYIAIITVLLFSSILYLGSVLFWGEKKIRYAGAFYLIISDAITLAMPDYIVIEKDKRKYPIKDTTIYPEKSVLCDISVNRQLTDSPCIFVRYEYEQDKCLLTYFFQNCVTIKMHESIGSDEEIMRKIRNSLSKPCEFLRKMEGVGGNPHMSSKLSYLRVEELLRCGHQDIKIKMIKILFVDNNGAISKIDHVDVVG
jgi:hypothetical protein